MGNYVIGVGNYMIVNPSELGNYKIADSIGLPVNSPEQTTAYESAAAQVQQHLDQ